VRVAAVISRLLGKPVPGSGVRGILDKRIIQNTFALYGSAFGNYLLPLVTVPYLARVLGPETWGLILFVQAIGLYLVLVVDYSFDFAGGRAIAKHVDDRSRLGEIVAGVLGARLVLAAVAVAVLAGAQLVVPALGETGSLLWLGIFFYLGVALRPFWFFLGMERVRGFLVLELTLKALAVVGIILFVNSPSDAWLVLALQGTAAALTVIAGMAMVYRLAPVQLPSISRTVSTLRDGWSLFVLRLSGSVVTMGNTIILGLLATPVIVGYYAGAERINRLLISMMFPMLLALFPRASGLATDDPGTAARLARMSTLIIVALAAVGCMVLYFLAPLIIRVTLGPDYSEAVRTLRILLLLLPITGPTIALSVHWMIPSGLDKLLTRISLSGSLMHIPLAVFLGTRFAHVGVAWAVVITETYILFMLLTMLVWRGLGPFRINFQGSRTETRVSQ